MCLLNRTPCHEDACGGGGAAFLFNIWYSVEASGHLNTVAALLGEERCGTIGQEAHWAHRAVVVGPRAVSVVLVRNCLPVLGIEPPFPGCLVVVKV
jgi:hypothetical protein